MAAPITMHTSRTRRNGRRSAGSVSGIRTSVLVRSAMPVSTASSAARFLRDRRCRRTAELFDDRCRCRSFDRRNHCASERSRRNRAFYSRLFDCRIAKSRGLRPTGTIWLGDRRWHGRQLESAQRRPEGEMIFAGVACTGMDVQERQALEPPCRAIGAGSIAAVDFAGGEAGSSWSLPLAADCGETIFILGLQAPKTSSASRLRLRTSLSLKPKGQSENASSTPITRRRPQAAPRPWSARPACGRLAG